MSNPAIDINALQKGLSVCAPRLNFDLWKQPLDAAFVKFDISTPRRTAAAMGQFLVEAGPAFGAIVEDLYYSTAARLVLIFRNEIPDVAAAAPYVANPAALGNFVYAGRNGNGDEASGDGYLFRGRGLIDVTGRTAYTALAEALDMELAEVPAYCETPAGAAMSGCWWLASHGGVALADEWDVAGLTRLVNGPAMSAAGDRLSYSTDLLGALGGTPA